MATDEVARAAIVCGSLMISSIACHGKSAQASALGRDLFNGSRPLAARIVGHTIDLPQDAVQCTNCHRHEAREGSDASSQDFGPLLSRERLTGAVARRGGPPSVYDSARLCRVLREGIDPAYVVISQTMPRYTFTDSECEALWTYLTAS